jgi:hypothetical protein
LISFFANSRELRESIHHPDTILFILATKGDDDALMEFISCDSWMNRIPFQVTSGFAYIWADILMASVVQSRKHFLMIIERHYHHVLTAMPVLFWNEAFMNLAKSANVDMMKYLSQKPFIFQVIQSSTWKDILAHLMLVESPESVNMILTLCQEKLMDVDQYETFLIASLNSKEMLSIFLNHFMIVENLSREYKMYILERLRKSKDNSLLEFIREHSQFKNL